VSAPRILVVRNDKLGDFMLAWPALAILRASLPEAHIEVLVPEYTREVAELCPSIDSVLIDPGAEAGSAALIERLRSGRYDALLTLFSTTRIGWAGWRAGIAYRLAPATKLAQFFYNDRLGQRRSRSEKPEWDYNADLVRRFVRREGCEVQESAPPYLSFETSELVELEQCFRAEHGLESQRLVFVHAGSGGSARNLSLEQYARLAAALESDRGHTLVLTAGPGERAYVDELAATLGSRAEHLVLESLGGLTAFAKLVALADVFIAGSTGTLHVAGALDVPTAAFYPRRLSSTPLRWQTLNRAERRLSWCPSAEDAESDMSSIDVEEAAREISARFLARAPR
jgi:ADP-heptose:LPS heptosyltransferase